MPGLAPDSLLEICERAGNGKRIWIIINHGAQTETLALPVQRKSFIVGSHSDTTGNNLRLTAHDVVVLEVNHAP